MKSKQVLSIEQMKHLQELGLDTSDTINLIPTRKHLKQEYKKHYLYCEMMLKQRQFRHKQLRMS